MKRVLVTGGAGFIGSHLCCVLIQKGFDIYVIDSYVNSSEKSLERVSFLYKDIIRNDKKTNLKIFKGDIKDKIVLKSIFDDAIKTGQQIEAVIHLAGLKSVNESIKEPLKYWDANVFGSINLLKVMNSYNCKTIVFSSTAAIYGLSENLDENSTIEPLTPYGVTKMSVENLLKDVFESESNQWKIANLRYFNPIGAHPSGDVGESNIVEPRNIFPILLGVAQGKIDHIEIYGDNWPTKDGTAIRDYIHVMDLAVAHLKILELLQINAPQILNINIGTGVGTSVLELIKTFEETNNVKIPYVFSDRRQGDHGVVIANNEFLSKKLEWSPEFSIQDMCKDGWAWKEKNPNGY